MQNFSFFFMMFASLGVINGFFLSIYYLWKRKSTSDVFLSGLLLALSIRIGKSIYFRITEELDYNILQFGLSACLFIGPFFYMYIRSHSQTKEYSKRLNSSILLFLLASILVVGVIYPYTKFPDNWNNHIVQTIYAVWLIFVVLGLIELRKLYLRKTHSKGQLTFLLYFSLAILFITLTYHFAYYIKGFTYLWGSYIFTITFYYLAWLELTGRSKNIGTKKTAPPLSTEQSLIFKDIDAKIDTQKLFKNPKLRLDDVAKVSDIDRNLLSKMVNEIYPHGFAHYINAKRVDEAIKLLQSSDQYSIEGIGFESGFNSKSSFFATFKKITGKTPTQYKNQPSN